MTPTFLALLTTSLTVAQLVSAQIPLPHSCPSISAVEPLDIEKFAGLWFEVERIFFLPEITGSCVSVNFTVRDDGSVGSIIRFREALSGQKMVYPGSLTFRDVPTDGKYSGRVQMTVNYLNPYVLQAETQKLYKIDIIATDYDNYAIVWACKSLANAVHFESLWVLGRDRTYPTEVKVAVRTFLALNDIGTTFLQPADQTLCS